MTTAPIIVANSGREFPTFPVAVLAYVINSASEFLLMRRPQKQTWEIPSGVLEANEPPEIGVARELREELGEKADFELAGLIHAAPIRFDESIPCLISLGFLVKFLGGVVVPSDDMLGAETAWCTHESILARTDIEVPNKLSYFATALKLFHCL
ncbi:MAG: NUDIX hydrolase [Pseudomonadota bacterium]